MSWDKEEAAKLRKEGLTQEQIGFVLGRIAEHRQQADGEGWKRAFYLVRQVYEHVREQPEE